MNKRSIILNGIFAVMLLVAISGCGQQLKQENEQLKTQVQSLTDENNNLKTQVESLTKEKDGFKTQVDVLIKEIEALKTKPKKQTKKGR